MMEVDVSGFPEPKVTFTIKGKQVTALERLFSVLTGIIIVVLGLAYPSINIFY